MRTVAAEQPGDILRPFLWVAALAFSSGFFGYLAFGASLAQAG